MDATDEMKEALFKSSKEENIKLQKDEMEELLRHGAYDVFNEAKAGVEEEESKKFCEEDIDAILKRSEVIVHDNTKEQDSQQGEASGGFNFSKANFSSSNADNVDINDPDFWQKV